MKNSILLILLFYSFTFRQILNAQNCPEFATSTPTTTNNCDTPDGCTLCAGNNITLSIDGTDFPANGTIDWYISDTSNFNPYNAEGTNIGSSATTTAPPNPCDICPSFAAILLDACNGSGAEQDNEFAVINTGSGFNLNDLYIDFADGNNQFSTTGENNNDINIGANPCGFQTPTTALMSSLQNDASCSATNVIAINAGESVPPGALLFVFTSANYNTDYDFSNMCALGATIYVAQSSCTRGIGAFTNVNGQSNPNRTYEVGLNSCSSCSDDLTYVVGSGSPAGSGANGDFVYKDESGTVQYENNGCEAPPVEQVPLPSAPSSSEAFTYTFDDTVCGQQYIVGIINPMPSSIHASCSDIISNELSIFVSCPEIEVVSTTNTDCDGNLGAIEVNVSNAAAGDITYNWTPTLGNTNNPTNLPAGNYGLEIDDGAGCTANLPTDIIIEQANCCGGTIMFIRN